MTACHVNKLKEAKVGQKLKMMRMMKQTQKSDAGDNANANDVEASKLK